MGVFDKVKKLAEEAKKKTESNNNNNERYWEKSDLNDLEKIMKYNVKVSGNRAKNGGAKEQQDFKNEKTALERVQEEKKKRKLYQKGKAMSDTYYKVKKRDTTDDYLSYE